MTLVGIFSRESESCYRWLVNKIVAWRNVRDVRSVPITNNSAKFREETSKCDFAILYHSRNRGRINVTDVTDSLYDEELQYLNDVYGKKNVLVVIDDLNDSSDEEKSRILSHQPSIQRLAQDLFLFSSADKAALNTLGYQVAHNPPRALEKMRRIIEGAVNRPFYGQLTRTGSAADFNVNQGTEHSIKYTEDPDTQDIESQGDFLPPRRRRPTRLCMFIIAIIVLVTVILIIVLSQSLTHVSPTISPDHTTKTPELLNISINVTTAG